MSESILIVDDESQVVEVFQEALQQAGYSVSAAENGRKAIELIQTSKFDLVLLDIVMPDMDGIEVLRELLKAESKLKVIAMSGMLDSQFLRVAQHLGAVAAIYKPISLEALRTMVSQILNDEGKAIPPEEP
jgi:CheY-like chemotaxis protein